MTLVAQPADGGYDVIIVGSGPAGLTVAKKLEELTEYRVLIVESGVEGVGQASKLAEVEAEGHFGAGHFAHHSQRIFGGTSNVWAGWCAVLDERPFLAGEWPFPYRELYRYYPEAARILNVPPVFHERPEVAFDDTGGNVVYRPWSVVPVRFGMDGDSFGAEQRSGAGNWVWDSTTVDVLLGHTAMHLATRDGVVDGVSLVRTDAAAKPFHVAAGCIVLAAGGIQNARLLLLSLGEQGRPRALGRYFTEHPHYRMGFLEIDMAAVENAMGVSIPPLVESDPVHGLLGLGIGLSSPFSIEHSVLSATVDLQQANLVEAVLAGRRRPALAGPLDVRAEMAPTEGNRVELSNTEVDFLGQPCTRVAMTFDFAAAKNAVGLLNAELVRAGIGRFQVSAPPSPVAKGAYAVGGGHFMGTTRMGSDPARSVTDAAGKVHGFSNLYVAGSSLFPASSAANPTLTIVALALRLGEHLAAQAR